MTFYFPKSDFICTFILIIGARITVVEPNKIRFWKIKSHRYCQRNGIKECEVANFHGQATDIYAYV
jgi:hypothetical protein